LTGARVGWVLSREISESRAPTLLIKSPEGHTPWSDSASLTAALRGRRPQACAESPCARTGRSLAARRRWNDGPHREGQWPCANDERPGDVGPARSTDEAAEQSRASGDGGGGGKGSGQGEHGPAKRAPDALTIDRLRTAFLSIKKEAAPGVDGVRWEQYQADLEGNLRDLHGRLQRGAYRARPSRRAYIPKADGRLRPLGIATLEDKVVQRAAVEVMNAIYEADFLGFSYGFRSGRGQHDAVDALSAGIYYKKVNWMLDADIRGYFDTIDHGWLKKFIAHRIADRRLLRLIGKWLAAGVMEDGKWAASSEGTPQGASVSPLLANIFLHYALDLWVQQCRQRHARGDVIITRYADDFVVGFQHHTDAVRFQEEFRGRLRGFGLELHPEKTRLIEFGRLPSRGERGETSGSQRPSTFWVFTHISAES
jgi:RNA-directed DNA polymerase